MKISDFQGAKLRRNPVSHKLTEIGPKVSRTHLKKIRERTAKAENLTRIFQEYLQKCSNRLKASGPFSKVGRCLDMNKNELSSEDVCQLIDQAETGSLQKQKMQCGPSRIYILGWLCEMNCPCLHNYLMIQKLRPDICMVNMTMEEIKSIEASLARQEQECKADISYPTHYLWSQARRVTFVEVGYAADTRYEIQI